MYNRWFSVIAAILLAVIVGGIAYNAGVHQGIAQSGKITIAAPPPYPYAYPYYGWHPGFFFFPFLFVFLFFFVARGLFWRARWHHGHHNCYRGENRDTMGNVSV